MAVFAIGDVQGCLDELLALLDKLRFEPEEDQLWFTGDLVNRGPKSLETLRFVRGLGDNAITVLGNHDLHCLAVAEDFQALKRADTLSALLKAPDRDELLHWLRHRPLAHYDDELGYLLVHAGLPPQWDLAMTLACAREVESALRAENYRDVLRDMYGDLPARWDDSLTGMERLRFMINAFSRMRYCSPDGDLDFRHKGPPGSQADGLLPWFEVPGRRSARLDVLFGHWSTLRLGDHANEDGEDGLDMVRTRAWALDTGCLWGGTLTALRLDGSEAAWTSLPCPGSQRPGQ